MLKNKIGYLSNKTLALKKRLLSLEYQHLILNLLNSKDTKIASTYEGKKQKSSDIELLGRTRSILILRSTKIEKLTSLNTNYLIIEKRIKTSVLNSVLSTYLNNKTSLQQQGLDNLNKLTKVIKGTRYIYTVYPPAQSLEEEYQQLINLNNSFLLKKKTGEIDNAFLGCLISSQMGDLSHNKQSSLNYYYPQTILQSLTNSDNFASVINPLFSSIDLSVNNGIIAQLSSPIWQLGSILNTLSNK